MSCQIMLLPSFWVFLREMLYWTRSGNKTTVVFNTVVSTDYIKDEHTWRFGMDLICFDSKIHLELLWTYCRSCPVWHLALFPIVVFSTCLCAAVYAIFIWKQEISLFLKSIRPTMSRSDYQFQAFLALVDYELLQFWVQSPKHSCQCSYSFSYAISICTHYVWDWVSTSNRRLKPLSIEPWSCLLW